MDLSPGSVVADTQTPSSSKSPSLNGGSSSGETVDTDSGKGSSLASGSSANEEVAAKANSLASIIIGEAEALATLAMEYHNFPKLLAGSSESASSPDEIPSHSESLTSVQPNREPGPSGSSGSGIKKRTTTSQSRNYRSSNLQLDPESSASNDTEAFKKSSKSKATKDSDSEEEDECDLRPFKFRRAEVGGGTGTSADESSLDFDLSSNSHQSSQSSPGGFNYHDFDDEGGRDGDGDETEEHSDHDHSSGRSTPESVTRARLEAEILHSGSSSSSSSFIVENTESSSSSSSLSLEDLDERPATPRREDATSSETVEPSSTSTPPPKSKRGKAPKKPAEIPKVLLKPKPKHTWNAPKELLRREFGLPSRAQPQSAEIFRSKFYGSLISVERLELMKKLDGHHGCVNCLNFNYSGTRLASGSDDLQIKIWNYAIGKCITSFQSGHKANVFQAKFVPFNGIDTMLVSCARDNQVRLNELDSTGKVCSSRKLAQHRGPAHKLSVSPDNPHVILSCGEDGVVFNIDIREEKPERLVKVFEKDRKIALFSIHQNPISPHEFCVSGKDQYVRIYDTRKLRTPNASVAGSSASVGNSSSDGASSSESASNSDNAPLKKFCPHHLSDSRAKTNVTAAVYNYNGGEILASYNDENIYLFDATHSDGADCIKVYEGHRNNATVKGVNFFGDRSQFVVSGSDCGNIFIWDKETESIVNFFRGDDNGVVNCLEGHPTAPILATSGLDDDVKIWIPSNEKPPKMSELVKTVTKNLRNREDELKNADMDGHIMWALWSHLRQADRDRRNRAAGGDASDSNESWWRDEDDDEDDEALDFASRGVECSIC